MKLLPVVLTAALSAQTVRVLALQATGKLDGGVIEKTRIDETPVSTTEDAPYVLQLVET